MQNASYWTACMLLTLIIGCGQIASVNHDIDSNLHRETLVAALDAWKSGQPRTHKKRIPPIRLVEDDLVSGSQLFNFEIEPKTIMPHKNVKVTLLLRDIGQRTIEKPVPYQIAIKPSPTVLRSDN